MLTFYLIRHGTTSANINRLVMGYNTNEPLIEEGINDAKYTNENLPEDIDIIYSSDLGRTKSTAKIISEQKKINKIVFSKSLREINYGIYS